MTAKRPRARRAWGSRAKPLVAWFVFAKSCAMMVGVIIPYVDPVFSREAHIATHSRRTGMA